MILSIGELLVDMIGETVDGTPNFKAFGGGAPFNVAVNAKQSGAKVGFVGRIGSDPLGKFLTGFSNKVGFDYLNLQIDEVRNTTIAFVTLTDGERDFAFFRHKTADYNLSIEGIDFSNYDIVHLGSLMLSEKEGVDFAKKVVKKVRKAGKILSFDVNFRKDLYKDFTDAVKAYKPFIAEADILKFSDDEILDFTGKSTIEDAVKEIQKPNKLLLITLGSKGSSYYYNDISGTVGTEKVKPVDTTGAGDAFFGCFLANVDGKELTKENIENALVLANKKGAEATQFKGAVKID